MADLSPTFDVDKFRIALDRKTNLLPTVHDHVMQGYESAYEQFGAARRMLRFASSEQVMQWDRRVQVVHDEAVSRILSAPLQSAALDSTRELLSRVTAETVGVLKSPAVTASERKDKLDELLGSVHLRAAATDEDLARITQLARAVEDANDEARSALARASEADSARREAMSVAATTGDTALSKGFTDLQKREARAAGVWTTFAIATTFVGIGVGWATHMVFAYRSDVAGVVYPAVIALAFVGLAAYFARLGGHRRHTAQWAKSIAVQLDSYEKFIHHAEESARGPIFDRFAARVLGDPPTRNAKGESPSFSVSDVVALLSKQP